MDFQSGSEMENTNSYRVEVSGWDASEKFFVEKTALTWGGDEKKEINLRSSLREGSVVFVHLLQAFAEGPSHTDFLPGHQCNDGRDRTDAGSVGTTASAFPSRRQPRHRAARRAK